MFSVCCSTQLIRNSPSALGINFLYFGLIFFFELSVSASGRLSENTNSFILMTSFSHTRLLDSYLSRFSAEVSRLTNISHVRASLAKRLLRNMRGDALLNKSKSIADGTSNIVTPGVCLDSTEMNEDTSAYQ